MPKSFRYTRSIVSRRELLLLAGGAPLLGQGTRIDRRALVGRHSPVLREIDARAPLSVGNGEFAFTADVTGVQSIPDLYEKTTPLCTQSQWGWHSFPQVPGNLALEMFDTYGRPVGYATNSKGQEAVFNYLRENPHRLNLGRIGILLDGAAIQPKDITNVHQVLDLWTGTLRSRFQLRESWVTVVTVCHPSADCLAVQIQSPLVEARRISVAFDFPYGSPAMNASDWKSGAKHTTAVTARDERQLTLWRKLDNDIYNVRLRWEGNATVDKPGEHRVILTGPYIDFTCEFARNLTPTAMEPAIARRASESHWARFWSSSGAIDLANSADNRAEELERRIVLSQYLTAIQCSGSTPPQETGLTCNSWYGKYHLEMHWWHAAHFALWDRTPMLERSMPWYRTILPVAKEKARKQGYIGARWPKMTSPDGHDSPSGIGELLIWQQPHPIVMAELCYRSHPNRETLDRYREVVFESANFMASFAALHNNRYVLGPPVIPAQENHPPRETWNPTFELAYWHEALGVAQKWRERLSLKPDPKWEDVRSRLAPLPVKDGVYLAHEGCPQTFTDLNYDHPSMLAAFGVLNGEGVDRETMARTLDKVFKEWRWADTWGWDFPMVAMTAARLGQPEKAIDALFIDSPKNTWLKNGHNWQRGNLPLYLPGNGGLLAAVAMMASAWNGFPKATWSVRAEHLKPLLNA